MVSETQTARRFAKPNRFSHRKIDVVTSAPDDLQRDDRIVAHVTSRDGDAAGEFASFVPRQKITRCVLRVFSKIYSADQFFGLANFAGPTALVNPF